MSLTRLCLVVSFGAGCAAPRPVAEPLPVAVQAAIPERAIRRDIPMTSTIRRAHAMGTRDSTGRPGSNYWQNRVDYVMRIRLDVPTNRVHGTETITIRNNSDSALGAVLLRLDQNIFAPHAARHSARPPGQLTDGMRVTRMAVNGAAVTIVPPTYDPTAGVPRNPAAYNLHQTVAIVRLAQPIAPKGQATMDVEWNFEVPGVPDGRGLRMGRFADSLYQLAQWYPRVMVHDDLRGWDNEPYLGSSEFYNNFGRFDVSLDVPAGWLVGATGVLQNPDAVLSARTRERLARVLTTDSLTPVVAAGEGGPGRATASGDRLVWRFVADSVNDFAWATSRNYVWEATRVAIPGAATIPLHLLYLPGNVNDFRPAAPVSRHALQFYSQLWFPYPFPQLTLADGPELGMEYPMFLMSAVGAADHEVGHEWWPMVVSNNETWYGWMDEGFNQYMNTMSDAHIRGRAPNFDNVGQSYGRVQGAETESPMMWPANYQAGFYGYSTYFKTPPMLSMLGAIVGDSTVVAAMRGWANEWKFKHPSPWDFMFYMNHALGQDLGWFWNAWLFTTEAVHASIESASANIGTGIAGPATVVVRQEGAMPSPVVLRVKLAAGGSAIRAMPNSRMTDSLTAVVTYPVDVWFAGARTFRAVLDFGRAIESVTLDPFSRFPDRNPRDNVWPR